MGVVRILLFSAAIFLFVFSHQTLFAVAAVQKQTTLDTLLTMSLEELIEVEVTVATGTPKLLKVAPAVATVITAEEIKRTGARTLDEALQTVPGFTVMPSNHNRLNSVYSLRGIHTQQNPQVLRMIDGIPVWNGITGGWPNTFTMSTNNIEKVEVIRGPGSALYGANAFSGVINIITKKADDIGGVNAGIRAGSFGYTDTWFQYGSTLNGWDVAFSFDYLRKKSDESRIVDADLQTALDSALGTSASYAPGPIKTDDHVHDVQLRIAKNNWNLRFWKWGLDSDGQGTGVAQILDPKGKEDVDLYIGDITYKRNDIVTDLDVKLLMRHTYLEQESQLFVFPPGAALPIGVEGNVDFENPSGVTFFPDGLRGIPAAVQGVDAIDMFFTYRGLDNHFLQVSGGYEYSTIEPEERKNYGPGVLDVQPVPTVRNGDLVDVTGTEYAFMQDASRSNWHVLFQDIWSMSEKWELTAGIRYDDYNDFGSTTNPRLALVWEMLPELTTKLLYGRAFRAPNFSELYIANTSVSRGNKNLEPETIDTAELVLNYMPSPNLTTSLNFFAYEIDGLIDFIADPGQTTKTAQNAYDQEGRGFEIEMKWLITNQLYAQGNFSYQHAENKDTGDIVPFAPEMVLYANVNWMFLPEWTVDAQYYWFGGRNREVGDPREDIKDNDLVNLTIRRTRIFDNFEAAISIRNLFDEDVREPSTISIPGDYPMEKRSFWAELRFHY